MLEVSKIIEILLSYIYNIYDALFTVKINFHVILSDLFDHIEEVMKSHELGPYSGPEQ
jgi:hypothetical protein